MPTYEYTCTDCGHDLEVFQKFSDDPLTVCPDCNGHLRKVFSPVGVVFKGSGFYATDNRTSGASTAPGSSLHDTESAHGADSSQASESATHTSGDASTGSSTASGATTSGSTSTSGSTTPTASTAAAGSGTQAKVA